MPGKPNPLLHMLFWGTGSGTILALLYMLFIFGFGTVGLLDMLIALITPSLWLFALQIGGFPGAVLGLATGIALWALSAGFREPFNRAEMHRQRLRVYAVIGGLTTLGGFALTLLVFGLSSFAYLGILLMIPPFIAGIAAAYAAHRYMFGLRRWTEQHYGIQKEKAKNIDHLEDALRDEESNDEQEAESQERKSS